MSSDCEFRKSPVGYNDAGREPHGEPLTGVAAPLVNPEAGNFGVVGVDADGVFSLISVAGAC